MTLAGGSRLGPYTITAKLGEGGMGEVWRATDSRLDREVAIKVLPESLADDPDRLARFEREAKMLAALDHPNIAAIYEVGEAEVTGPPRVPPPARPHAHFLVMQLAEGETLAEHIARGTLDLEETLAIAHQIAEALEAAHEKGIVHRDLKPHNVKVTPEGQVKVLDFGLAKAMDPADTASGPNSVSRLAASPTLTLGATVQGVILGTAGYMAPEQAKGAAVDKRADIWAFGVVLYEMLTGTRLFEGDSVPEMLASVLKSPIDLGDVPADVPAAIRHLLRRCLERNPKNRLHDIADARLVLDDQVAGRLDDEGSPGFGAPHSPAEGGSRAVLPWSVASLLALALVSLTLWVRLGPWQEEREPRLSFDQKTFDRSSIFTARFASDGRTIVYSGTKQGSVPQLHVIRPEYPEPQPFGEPATHLLSISSRDELAVLTRARWIGHRQFEGTLGRMPLGGGAPRELIEKVREADWLPEGTDLAIVRDVDGKDRLEFPIGKVLYETPGYLSDLRVSPRGDRVAFFEHPHRWDNRGSVVTVDRSGERTVLASGYEAEEGLAWEPDGRAIYYSAKVVNTSQAHRVDLDGRDRVVMPVPGGVTIQDLAGDGRKLFTRDELSSQVLVRPPGEVSARDVSWLDYSLSPLLSRDGRLLVVTDSGTTGGLNYTTLMRRTDGSPFVRLGEGQALALSPDGLSVAVNVPSPTTRLMLYPTGSGEPRRIDRGQLEAYTDVDWFADGSSLLVCGNEAGEASRCFVMSLDDGSLRAVTPEGTRKGRISPDGRRVAAHSFDGHALIYPLDGGTARALPEIGFGDTIIRFSPDGSALWFFTRSESPVKVRSLDLATESVETLETIELPDPTGVLQVLWMSLADDPASYILATAGHSSQLFVAEEKP